jgi:hypothetical protein
LLKLAPQVLDVAVDGAVGHDAMVGVEPVKNLRARGYRRAGKHEASPHGDDSEGTPLPDDLQFVVLEKAL